MYRNRTTKSWLGIVLSLALLLSIIPMAMPAPALAADPSATTSLIVTKYAPDGTTVLATQTLSLAELQALPVQGDGTTHYFMQGPTFDPANLWDPAETINLKDKGAIKGTDVKDLCNLVGGAVDGDEIQLKAVDGYNERFHYADIYNPETAQGKFVLAWYTKDAGDTYPQLYPNGAYVPDFADGIQLVFTPDDHIFGHQNMKDTLPEDNWHYYYDGTIQYPSVNGLSIKYISEVAIYTQAAPQWSINVTGIVNQTVDQGWFENALSCHETASWTDGSGNVWSGLPLWYLVGLADDTIIHGPGAFNDAVAAAGYTVQVMAGDGIYNKTFPSADVARNNGYIVANQKNGLPIPEADSNYPLKLVGTVVANSGSLRVGNIASINLLNVPVINTWTVQLSGASDYTMAQAEFESGVNCPTNNHSATYTDASGTWKGLPLWLLAGYVDDANQHGPSAFNDVLAVAGYQIKVIASDGYSYTFDSVFVARNDDVIVANTLEGAPLPETNYPLQLVGGALTSDEQKVSRIVKIELLNLPYTLTTNVVGSGSVAKNPDQATYTSGTPVELTATAVSGWNFTGWSGDLTGTTNPATLTMDGNKTVTATFTQQQWSLQLNGMTKLTLPQSEFETLATTYPLSCVVTNKDSSTNTYSGVALWRLVGKVDDGDAATMNGDYAAKNYTIRYIASDGFSKTLTSTEVLNNDTYIVANMMDGAPLPTSSAPLRVVWQGTVSGRMVSKLTTIEFAIPWEVQLVGASTLTMPNTEFEALAAANPASCVVTNKDATTDTYNGTALWRLLAKVDDSDPTTFNSTLADFGYSVKITASDGFSKTVSIADARSDSKIVANTMNGNVLPENKWPLRYVWTATTTGTMISKIAKIEIINLPHTIVASAGAGGSITPSGNVIVAAGGNQTFSMATDPGYIVADVLVDGVSVGAVTSYEFTNVTTDRTISVSFEAEPTAPVPEFPTALLLGMGLAAVAGGLFWVSRRGKEGYRTN